MGIFVHALLGRGQEVDQWPPAIAFEDFEASVRERAGALLGDDRLSQQARLQKDVESGRVTLPKNGHFEVELRLADGSVYPKKGKLNFSDVRISPQTGTREARAELPNAEGKLRPGQFVRVILRVGTITDILVLKLH